MNKQKTRHNTLDRKHNAKTIMYATWSAIKKNIGSFYRKGFKSSNSKHVDENYEKLRETRCCL